MPERLRTRLAVGVGIAIAATVATVVLRTSAETPCGELELTAARWSPIEARSGSPSVRQRLTDDILRCDALRADTKAQVLEKLGRPSGSKAADTWEWVIGKDDFIGFPEVVSVRFGGDGRVRRVSTSRR